MPILGDIQGDKVVSFYGGYGITMSLTLNNSSIINEYALCIDTATQAGKLTEHTYFSKEQAIAIAKAILEELK